MWFHYETRYLLRPNSMFNNNSSSNNNNNDNSSSSSSSNNNNSNDNNNYNYDNYKTPVVAMNPLIAFLTPCKSDLYANTEICRTQVAD